MRSLVSFFVGLLFALGLGLSGMTQPQIVKGFLDVFGEWNPALMGVMFGAIGIHSVLFYFITKRSSPILDIKFHLPNRKDVDVKLFMGAALFGIGWGWGGICPGPGLVASLGGNPSVIIFLLSMFMGMILFKITEKFLS
jgi:uncharacterized membrane protein YedE/YeeE